MSCFVTHIKRNKTYDEEWPQGVIRRISAFATTHHMVDHDPYHKVPKRSSSNQASSKASRISYESLSGHRKYVPSYFVTP